MNMTNTEETIFLLLRNGKLLSWGDPSFTLGRKCKNAGVDCYLPMEIIFKKPILDIACGKNHCLVRCNNHEVYSWGSNECGQVNNKK